MVFIKERLTGWWNKFLFGIYWPFKKAWKFITTKDGDQTKPNLKNLGFIGGFFLVLAIFSYALTVMNQDTSSVEQTDLDINMPTGSQAAQNQETTSNLNGLLGKEEKQEKKRKRSGRNQTRLEPIKYKAKQVIEREGVFNPTKTIPMGTNLIGRLLTSIDTRESEQFYKVFLPYGGKFKSGAEIPKGSTLFGKIRYPGKGKKVFIAFSKGVFPDGSEFQIQAQALSTGDYSPGLVGDYHGQSGARVAATLGLSLVSGAASMLTEREQIGALGQRAPKPTLKNALYGGLSQTAQTEAQRQAQQLSERQEYVTVDAGKDLIINLTGAYIEQ